MKNSKEEIQLEKDLLIETLKTQVKHYKKELARIKKQLSLCSVVSSSNMRKALETVVSTYEDDGMECMGIRDDIFYDVCKDALDFDDEVSS